MRHTSICRYPFICKANFDEHAGKYECTSL